MSSARKPSEPVGGSSTPSSNVFGWAGLAPDSNEYLHLDVMRFVAAMAIVVLHFLGWLGLDSVTWLRFDGLQLFVDVFFVISGAIITYVYGTRISQRWGFRKFAIARVARLVPLHWATTLFYVAVGLAALFSGVDLDAPEKYNYACLPQVMLLAHAIDGCSPLQFNFVSWSIGAEFVMYLFFPAFVFIVGSSGLRAFLLFAVVLTGLYLFDAGWWHRTYELGALRAAPGFLLGMTLYLNRDLLRRIPVPSTLFWPILLGVTAAMLSPMDQGLVVLLAYVGTAAIFIIDLRNSAIGRLSVGVRRIAPLGQLTYSCYMLHPLVRTVYLNFLGNRILGLSGDAAIIWAVLGLGVVLVVSYLSVKLFEAPARRVLRRFLSRILVQKTMKDVEA
ncbi:MAG: acyltransferase [Alphaproteobacteria bacterium]|nr:acyltransferase [Alphaproteobacteria bacterium]